jgi:PhzF family phenazine biosynthesis protein
MNIPIYKLDSFTSEVFSGNPAAVCPLSQWLTDRQMQSIAKENNLSETAFIVETQDGFHIRWFTPAVEVDLCGHATLATAAVIFEKLNYAKDTLVFNSRSGKLRVLRNKNNYTLDFPTDRIAPASLPENFPALLGFTPVEVWKGKEDFLLLAASEKEVGEIRPDFAGLRSTTGRGIIVTARGTTTDFVSRFFAPAAGIDEDPVTGSAHTTLMPFWSQKLGKTELTARQVSERGGYLECSLRGDRTLITGSVAFFLEGVITLPG